MSAPQIRFDDGAAYERYMGRGASSLATPSSTGSRRLPGLRWLDVGCGNGAFTEMLVERCAPVSVHGIDPSAEQLDYARTRPAAACRTVSSGRRDGAAFPGRLVRRCRPAAGDLLHPRPGEGRHRNGASGPPGRHRRRLRVGHAWRRVSIRRPCWRRCARSERCRTVPPSPDASRIDAMLDLWISADLTAVDTCAITVERTFADFDDYWTTILGGSSVRAAFTSMSPERYRAQLRTVRIASTAASESAHALRTCCAAVTKKGQDRELLDRIRSTFPAVEGATRGVT